MRGLVSGYASSCRCHSHDAPPPRRDTPVSSAVTLILTSPSSLLAAPVNWGHRGQDIRTVRANSIVRTMTVISCDHTTSRSVTIDPAVNVVERAATTAPGRPWFLREPGRAEQPGEGRAEELLGLLGAEQKLSPQRLPERPDADRVQAVEQLLALLAAQLPQLRGEHRLQLDLGLRQRLGLVAGELGRERLR